MKIKRFQAADMRQALAKVRDELGPDAVILASTRTRSGVEVSAAVDREFDALAAQARLDTPKDVSDVTAPAAAVIAPAHEVTPTHEIAKTAVVAATPPGDVAGSGDDMSQELRTLRRVLETQLAALAWNDHTRRSPHRTQLLRELTEIGFAHEVVAELVDAIPESVPLERSRALALARLADRLKVGGDRWRTHGGVVAFVGATGAGKTTTLIRLATLWTLQHGAGQLALVSTDARSYGAHERLRRAGRLLAAPVYALDSAEELPALLPHLDGQRLVLIDTAGLDTSQPAVSHDFIGALTSGSPRTEFALCLPASTQAAALRRAIGCCEGLRRSTSRASHCPGRAAASARPKGSLRLARSSSSHRPCSSPNSTARAPTKTCLRVALGENVMPVPELRTIGGGGRAAALLRHPVRVIAVTGGKGGVGKSSVAVNLAAEFAAGGSRTLLFDGDLGLANIDVLLGLTPRYSLAHVISGERSLGEVLIDAPQGFRIVPGASGVARLTTLTTQQHTVLIDSFSAIAPEVDALVVDTAAGIAPMVLQLAQAAQNVLVVVCDEPTSLTDAYALMKVLSRGHGVRRFRVLANMVRDAIAGRRLFETLDKVAARFLDVTLEYAGEVPEDPWMRRAIREQKPVVTAYPAAPAARALKELARRAECWPLPETPGGHVEFFAERLASRPAARLEVVR
jgi:flagellar biosynthesis protein FlhG